MISYINDNNPDDRILAKASAILEDGGLIAFPTDTTWCIAGSAFLKSSADKLRKLKGTFNNYTLTIACNSISQADELAEIDNNAFKFLKRYTPGPFVFILNSKKAVVKTTGINRPQVGIRIPSNRLALDILNSFGKPVFVIAASKSMSTLGWWDKDYAENNSFEYGYELDEIKEIDLIIDNSFPLEKNLTTVVDLTNGELNIIRQGLGII